ncbi:MAG: sulfotransferase domain-containing protein [Thalassococcus sp.]|uniref:sulfotransferase domain-containing protein n=1 Tax=Thalassococcus sp. TaxID=1928858 RepID=UPI001AFF9B9A|nr:sulfotransferase domain-containing protein [Thalassococcus sp.]MBO6867998.1 sulfotransferase domain-containing protein [Thalassococcus sp.]
MVDFLVLGTAKAGTTSIYRVLNSHTQICMSKPKETWHFDSASHLTGIYAYHEKYFPHCPDGKLRGEVATSYLFVPYVAGRIAKELPGTQLIAILRDPIERAYSDWWMMHTRGWDPLSFEDAIEDNFKRLENGPDFSNRKDWVNHLSSIRDQGTVQYRTYIDYGFYGTQLSRYHAAGLADRLLILQFEKMKRDGASYVEQVFDFLNLSPPVRDELAAAFADRQNEALPSRRIGQIVGLSHRSGLVKIIPEGAKQLIKTWLAARRGKPEISKEILERLRQIYNLQANELKKFSELDLSLWPTLRDSNEIEAK